MAPDQISQPKAPADRAVEPGLRRLVERLVRSGAQSHVPDIVTSLGLLAGCFSLISAINGHIERAAAMIGVCIVFDIADGLVARVSHTSSRFGLEYDSLSDVITFGVAPAILAESWALKPLGAWAFPLVSAYIVCAALRLARFNIQAVAPDGKRHFVGLPVPGAAAAIAGAAFGYHYFALDAPQALCAFMSVLMPVLAALMVSRVPYPAYKGADLKAMLSLPVIGLIAAAAVCFLAAPRLIAFIAGAGYLLSGPIAQLMTKGPEKAAVVSKEKESGRA